MLNILIIGLGGVGTIAAFVLEKSGEAKVTAVLRSNYDAVAAEGFNIDSVDHGKIQKWRPSKRKNAAALELGFIANNRI
jgi:ketopantoate reductase